MFELRYLVSSCVVPDAWIAWSCSWFCLVFALISAILFLERTKQDWSCWSLINTLIKIRNFECWIKTSLIYFYKQPSHNRKINLHSSYNSHPLNHQRFSSWSLWEFANNQYAHNPHRWPKSTEKTLSPPAEQEMLTHKSKPLNTIPTRLKSSYLKSRRFSPLFNSRMEGVKNSREGPVLLFHDGRGRRDWFLFSGGQ